MVFDLRLRGCQALLLTANSSRCEGSRPVSLGLSRLLDLSVSENVARPILPAEGPGAGGRVPSGPRAPILLFFLHR